MNDRISQRHSLTEIDDGSIRNFEADWMNGSAGELEQYLPNKSDPRYLATLEELIHIDLEFRWKKLENDPSKIEHTVTSIENFLEQFQVLDQPDVIERLAYQEFLVRHRYGDKPNIEEYHQRFPIIVSRDSDWEIPTVQHEATTLPQPVKGDLMDRYELVVEEGRGGFGAVWRARDPKLGREIAIKKLNDNLVNNDRIRQQFEDEARIASRLEHPGIVPVYDIGKLEGARPFYTMKLVQGETLDVAILKYHKDFKTLEKKSVEHLRLLNIFLSVTRAMEYAHSCGIIHRDLKPQNIVLGKFGETIILDWGLAKHLDSDHDEPTSVVKLHKSSSPYETQPGTVQGTPAYMSPEQASGSTEEIDRLSDVYALGIVLYQILSGRIPFPADSSAECLELVKRGDFPSPRTLEKSVSPAMEAICLKAMQTKKENRYASVADLRKDIERFLANEPLEAWSEPITYRLGRWTRRHKTIFVASMVGSIAIAIASVIGWIQYERNLQNEIRQQLDQTDLEEKQRLLENQRLAELSAAAETSQQAAIEEMREGQYLASLKFLDRGLLVVKEEPKLQSLFDSLAFNREKANTLKSFHRHAQKAEQLAYLEIDADAIEECLSALNQFHVFDQLEWWNQLPENDLSAETLDQLREHVYHQLVLLTALRLKLSVSKVENTFQLLLPPKKEQIEEFRLILDSAKMIQRYRPADSIRVIEEFCLMRLGERKNLPDVSNLRPQNASDSYMMGVVLFFIGAFGDDPITKLFLQMVIKTKDPLVTSREMLANASRLNSQHFQTHFFLGWCEEYSGRMSDAEKAYSHCISLQPENSTPYINRARIYMTQAILSAEKNPLRYAEFLRLCLRDLEQAKELEPYNAGLHFSRGQILAMLEYSHKNSSHEKSNDTSLRYSELALDAFFQGMITQQPLELIRSSRLRFLANDQIQSAYQFIQHLSKNKTTTKRRVNLLLMNIFLLLNRPDDAQIILDTTMESRSTDLSEFFLRGLLKYHRKEFRDAIKEFDSVLSLQENHFNSLLYRGMALESLGNFNDAILAYRQAQNIDQHSWQKTESMMGTARCLLKQSRYDDAIKIVHAALAIDPNLDLSRVTSLLKKNGRNEEIAILEQATTRIVLPHRTKYSSQDIRKPALLSGGFELGLSRHWGLGQYQQAKPIWWNSVGCRSTATVVSTGAHSGKKCLLIENFSKGAPEVYGTTQQAVPITPNARYRISLWAKAKNLEKFGFRIVVNKAWDIGPIGLPAGSFGWTRFSGEFSLPVDSAEVRLISLARGQVWIDDIVIEMIAPPK